MDDHRDDQQEALTKRFIQIPLEIMTDQRLTLADKVVFGRANFFHEFFESPTKTAEFLGISESQVRISKRKLESLGLLTCIANDGHGKTLIANAPRLSESDNRKQQGRLSESDNQTVRKSQPDCQNLTTEYKVENKVEKKKEKGEQPKQYGNADVNALLTAWAEATGFDYKNQKMERYAMAGLIKQHGLERTRALLRLVERARRSDDRFAPQIAKPSQLRGKYSKLEALTIWAERADKAAASIPAPIIPKNPDYFYEDEDYTAGETREQIHERCEALRAKYGFGPRKELDDER